MKLIELIEMIELNGLTRMIECYNYLVRLIVSLIMHDNSRVFRSIREIKSVRIRIRRSLKQNIYENRVKRQ